jgi:uncharacterized protein YuzE
MSIRFAGIVFDRVDYDRDVDVLYLHAGDPARAADWDESPEGHGLSFDSDGHLIGLTIVGARRRVDRDGRIVVTLREQPVEIDDLDDVLTPA